MTHHGSDNLDEAKLLFEALRQHKNASVKSAAAQGLAAINDGDRETTQTSILKVKEGLQSLELHPALARQLKLASAPFETTPDPSPSSPSAYQPALSSRSTTPSL